MAHGGAVVCGDRVAHHLKYGTVTTQVQITFVAFLIHGNDLFINLGSTRPFLAIFP
jgi:hypothetical protein